RSDCWPASRSASTAPSPSSPWPCSPLEATHRGSQAATNPRITQESHFYGADDGIRTRDPHLGNPTERATDEVGCGVTCGFVVSISRRLATFRDFPRPSRGLRYRSLVCS